MGTPQQRARQQVAARPCLTLSWKSNVVFLSGATGYAVHQQYEFKSAFCSDSSGFICFQGDAKSVSISDVFTVSNVDDLQDLGRTHGLGHPRKTACASAIVSVEGVKITEKRMKTEKLSASSDKLSLHIARH